MEPTTRKDDSTCWLIWQMLDSSFPIGSFAHSYGLETSSSLGLIHNENDILHFTSTLLEQTAGQYFPLFYEIYTSLLTPSTIKLVDLIVQLDCKLNLYLITNHVSYRASILQGNAFLRVTMQLFPELNHLLKPLHEKIISKSMKGHYSLFFGVICYLTKSISLEECQRMYLYSTLRDVLSACTRLNLAGPLTCARLQRYAAKKAEVIIQRYIQHPQTSIICQTCPLLDILQGSHDQLYTRLFHS